MQHRESAEGFASVFSLLGELAIVCLSPERLPQMLADHVASPVHLLLSSLHGRSKAASVSVTDLPFRSCPQSGAGVSLLHAWEMLFYMCASVWRYGEKEHRVKGPPP